MLTLDTVVEVVLSLALIGQQPLVDVLGTQLEGVLQVLGARHLTTVLLLIEVLHTTQHFLRSATTQRRQNSTQRNYSRLVRMKSNSTVVFKSQDIRDDGV